MGQATEIDHYAAAIDLVEAAYQQKKTGPRQYHALSKHAAKHSPEHIANMLSLMEHKTLGEAHKVAMRDVGK